MIAFQIICAALAILIYVAAFHRAPQLKKGLKFGAGTLLGILVFVGVAFFGIFKK